MTADRWQRIEDLFHRGVTVDPSERDAWLTRECGLDADLRRHVLQMLEADLAGDASLHGAVSRAAAAWSGQTPARIGPYRLVRELGAGGMGTVWLAARDDDAYQKLVAIKLLRAGLPLERFRQERQILAALEHPLIARLLDGGTSPEGQPYLVMEYADGPAITEWARREQPGLRRRCELFQDVCAAVAFAHRNLVVHRDLKPANILVTAQGPKLLDFGIAKLLGPEAAAEGATQLFFTPEYASPEQAAGGVITTATDVYALGAVFLELLTGRPFRSPRPLADALAAIRAGETPDTRGLPRDLARIVNQALSPAPADRYRSADALAEDIGRYLAGLPVEARGALPGYRLAKFVRRHWLPLAATLAVVAALGASAVYSSRQAARAEALRREAEKQTRLAEERRAEAVRQAARAETALAVAQRRFEETRGLNHRILFDLHAAIENLPGATPARRLMVKTALDGFDRLAREQSANVEVRRDLAQAYLKIGEVQAVTENGLGDRPGALVSYEKARALHESLPNRGPAWEATMLDLLNKRAMVYRELGQRDRAVAAFAQAIAFGGQAPEVRRMRAFAYRERGALWSAYGQYRDALKDARQSVALLEALPNPDREEVNASRRLLGLYLFRLGEFAEALALGQQVVSEMEALLANDPDNLRKLRRLIGGHVLVADVLATTRFPGHDLDKAIDAADRASAVAERISRLDPADILAKRQWTQALHRGGIALMQRQRYPEAIDRLRRAIALAESTGDDENTAGLLYVTAMTHQRAKQYDDAEPALRRSLALNEKLAAQRGLRTALVTIPSLFEVLGDIQTARGRRPDAAEAFTQSLRRFAEAGQRTDFVPGPHLERVRKKLAGVQ